MTLSAAQNELRVIFEYHFQDSKNSFSDWLSKYCRTKESFPFSLGEHSPLDLSHLIEALFPDGKSGCAELVRDAVQECLGVFVRQFEFEPISELATAIAESGFSPSVNALADTVRELAHLLPKAPFTTPHDRDLAFVAMDKIIGAIGGLAITNANAQRAARAIFNKDDFSPFASSVFCPVVLGSDHITDWPEYWERLVYLSQTPSELFDHEPDFESNFPIPGAEPNALMHFDLSYVFLDFLCVTRQLEYSFQEVIHAKNGTRYSVHCAKLASLIIDHLADTRELIISRDGDVDRLSIPPELWRPSNFDADETIGAVDSAIIEPPTTYKWTFKSEDAEKNYEREKLAKILDNTPVGEAA